MKLPNYVPGYGPTVSPLIIVGEAPGEVEDREMRPFTGPTGNMVDEILRECGSSLDSCYRTNVVKFRPPDNDLKKLSLIGHSIEEGIPQLWQEIQALVNNGTNAILSLGELSTAVLTGKNGITKYRGSILPSIQGFPKIVPSLHPARLLYSKGPKKLPYSARTYIKLDFARALEESKTKNLELPSRTLLRAHSSMDVWNFLELYKNELTVSVDIETPNCIPVCVGLAFNSYHALSIPLLNVYGIQIPQGQLIEIWRMLEAFFSKPGLRIVGQNFKFDHEKLVRPCGFFIPNPYFDCVFAAHVLHPELLKSLGFLASIYTREPFWKDEGKEYNPKKDSIDRLLLYNAKDAAVTFELYEKLLLDLREIGKEDYFFNYKMQLHELYMDIEREGFAVDLEIRKGLWLKYDALEKEAADHLFDIAGHSFNYRSNPQVCNVLYNELGFPKRIDRESGGLTADADALAGLYANHAKTPQKEQFLDNLLNIRRYGKTKSTYLEASPDYDGRHRTSIAICGTETTRTAKHVLKRPVRPTQVGLPFDNLTKHGDVGEDVRSILVVDDGTCLIEGDLSQAEPRIVAILAKDEELLEKFESGYDVHTETASECFGIPKEAVTKAIRFCGKKGRNGANYNEGKGTLSKKINSDAKRFHIDISVSEWKAGKILDAIHRMSPNIREVFHRDIEEALAKSRYLINPYGTPRLFMDRWGDDLFREGFAQIPQSTVADHIKTSALYLRQIYREKYGEKPHIVAEAHDALVLRERLDRKEEAARLLKKALERSIDFTNCTLSRGILKTKADLQISYTNYKDFKEFHVV